ncbi:MAG TPA: HlyD family efflux transporter periplasmic adaptor subunit [Sphingomicrobium sp.]|nr:HlyD family efflux transporter periplasmic adaptor subunit [Sphingomicrobium sp.]
MTLVELRQTRANEAVSGGAMDRVVEVKRIDRRLLIAGGALVGLLLLLAFWFFAPSANSQSVSASRVQISTARNGTFEDFLPIRGRVTPSITVYLDAVEGGRVEQVLVEDGANVFKGQLLAILSNSDLQLSTLARQTEVEQQLNNMRSQELALVQSRSANRRDLNQAQTDLAKARRQYELYKPLAEKGFVTRKQFNDAADDLNYQRQRLAILQQSVADDERLQSSQLRQLRASAASMNNSLAFARGSLDQLQLRAPATGQLTSFAIQLGQSLDRGERLGQIDSAGQNKLVADIDEFYLGRVAVGQTASAELGARTYRMRVAKVYPQVRNGQFQIDLAFDGAEPASMQRGQTLQAKLTLGDSTRALLIPNGSFFTETGGTWVFVVDSGGSSATRRQVQLGRRNNDFIEVLGGLKAGERVITSSYNGMTDKDRLTFDGGE